MPKVSVSDSALPPNPDLLKKDPMAEMFGPGSGVMWNEGAAELEKSPLGRIITAPVRLVDSVTTALPKVVTAAGDTAKEAPSIAKKLPMVVIILAVGVGAYLLYAGKAGTKLTPF
jgi:hypothetical protein